MKNGKKYLLIIGITILLNGLSGCGVQKISEESVNESGTEEANESVKEEESELITKEESKPILETSPVENEQSINTESNDSFNLEKKYAEFDWTSCGLNPNAKQGELESQIEQIELGLSNVFYDREFYLYGDSSKVLSITEEKLNGEEYWMCAYRINENDDSLEVDYYIPSTKMHGTIYCSYLGDAYEYFGDTLCEVVMLENDVELLYYNFPSEEVMQYFDSGTSVSNNSNDFVDDYYMPPYLSEDDVINIVYHFVDIEMRKDYFYADDLLYEIRQWNSIEMCENTIDPFSPPYYIQADFSYKARVNGHIESGRNTMKIYYYGSGRWVCAGESYVY